MDITFVGAARTVTGSLHLFEYKKQKFLLECGLYQGHRDDAERINKTFPFKPKDIKAVLLSHAHIDHSGNLPNLAKRGFEGPIYCTAATKDITSLLLVDSAKIQEYDIEFVNKKHRKNGLPLKEPLYTVADAERVLKQFSTIEYGQTFEPIPGVKATFYDAGHILGSSVILLEADGEKILFSGDLGRKNMPIIKDPTVVNDIDYLILESTYGSRTHKSFEGMTAEFENIIKEGKKRESKIIIPAFAVERTQLLVTMLKTLSDAGALKGVPVYVDSPLAMNVTEVFRKHPECFDKETYKIFEDGDPFDFPELTYITTNEESKSLNARRGPMIIMSASGMCEGGRVTHHLIHSIENDDNIIVMTGFQARGTLGRRILDGFEKIRIFNDEYRVHAKVYFMGGLSAHADSNDLLEYVKDCGGKRLKKVYLIHGDIEEATALQKKIETAEQIDVNIPQTMTHITI
ncbi:MAG TPA: MBL fold metallo-hydrolase [candidate division WOR-3 bacterium]|uniref:MBL fold metallo-hydrolase n=1 Tax=candidate division WOR-3 bacterium TaxID=2052148 RepID=A0A9C9ELQ8_UNCW3|nr:MBL fold metallo-hydrolase [candidate division WOR-3 bacterium]